MITAVLLAFGCAATFAISTSVQHQAAESAPDHVGLFQLLLFLARKPLWLLGQLLSTCAFALHALALHAGQLAVVQPIVVSGIVWAVPARAAMSRRLPSLDEVRAVTLTAGGLAIFLIASGPTQGTKADQGWSSVLLAAGAVAVAGVGALLARSFRHHPRQRAFFLGATAGVLFGLVAGLLKMALEALHDDGVNGVLTAWPTWAMVAAGVCGVITNQRAYQTAALSASMPALNIVNVLTALTFGFTVFNEIPRHGAPLLVVEAVALAAITFGLWLLVQLEGDLHEHPTLAHADVVHPGDPP